MAGDSGGVPSYKGAVNLDHTSRSRAGIAMGGLEPDGTVAGGARDFGQGGCELPRMGVDLRVIGRRGIIGRFVLVPTSGRTVSAERMLVAVALASALGLALAPASS